MNELIGFIADHPTPKLSVSDGVAYTLNSRDYKGIMVVILKVEEHDFKQLGCSEQTHTYD